MPNVVKTVSSYEQIYPLISDQWNNKFRNWTPNVTVGSFGQKKSVPQKGIIIARPPRNLTVGHDTTDPLRHKKKTKIHRTLRLLFQTSITRRYSYNPQGADPRLYLQPELQTSHHLLRRICTYRLIVSLLITFSLRVSLRRNIMEKIRTLFFFLYKFMSIRDTYFSSCKF